MPLANKGGPSYTPGRLFWAVEIVTVPAQTLIRLISLLCSRRVNIYKMYGFPWL